MGIKTRKYVRSRDDYDPNAFDQEAVDPSEIPEDAPTTCCVCGDSLTPLRRLACKPFCTKEPCLLAGRLAKTANWRMLNMHKQGDTLVIVDAESN